MNKITRSSKKWKLPKRKPGEKTITHKDFEIMSDGQHCYYLCKKENQLADKTHTRCEYIYRKDYVSSPEDLNHTCFYQEENITKYFHVSKSNEQSNHQNGYNGLQVAHIMFAGQTNLSLANSVDDSLYSLISEAIKLGQKFPTSNPLELYPKVTRTTFTKYFISLGNEIYEETIAKYRELGNVALAIDGGKEGSKTHTHLKSAPRCYAPFHDEIGPI